MQMKTNPRSYPMLSACGLNCGLCPRFYTEGTSRCPGCGGPGFTEKRPQCGVISCCQRHGGIEYCYLCEAYPCKKYDGAHLTDSFISHRNMLSDFARAKEKGMEAYQAELNEKMAILQALLDGYNDGRRKNTFCVAVNLLELQDVRDVMAQVADEIDPQAPVKEKAAQAAGLFQAMADSRGISLKLNKARAGHCGV